METLYRIVFNGETVPGLTAQQIIDAFAARFRVREQRAREIVLGGRRTVLKRGLDPLKAQRYSAALKQVGLLIVLEPQSATPAANLSVELNPSIDIGQSEMASYYDCTPEPKPAPKAAPKTVPTAAVGTDTSWQRCPKCREPAVSPVTGVCQSCGLVVERYLARRAEQANGADGGNPYAPPGADLTQPWRLAAGDLPRDPRRVPAGRAWAWIVAGFDAYRDAPLPWIGATLVFILLNSVTNVVQLTPVPLDPVASLVIGLVFATLSVVLGQLIIGGLMIGLDATRRGARFRVDTVFRGFSQCPGRLAQLGLAYVAAIVVTLLAAGLSVGVGSVLGAVPVNGVLSLGAHNPAAWIGAVVVLLGFSATFMLFNFAPALVAVGAKTPIQALGQSLRGCLRNIPAGLLYSLLWALLGIGVVVGVVVIVVIAKVIGQVGLIAQLIIGLSLLIGLCVLVGALMATLFGSIYAAYRDIYFR